ncbi:hypothetical protein Tco_1371135 [Tanacetum coccineum]
MSARIAKAAALSPSSFRKRYRSSYETPSPSSSLTLPVRKRYRVRMRIKRERERESHGLEDEGPGLEKEDEAAPEGQQQAVLVVDIAVSEPLGLGYGAARHRALESTEEIAPSTYEVGQSSRSVPEQEGAERISAFRQPTLVTWVDPEDGRVYTDIPTYVPLAAPVQTLPSPEWLLATISVAEDQFLDVGAQLELHRSILHDYTQRLDALPPILFEGYDRDLRKLYTRSGERENHDLRRQLAEERRERLELINRVARMERRHEFGGEK